MEGLEHYARGSGAQSIYQGRVGLGEGHRAHNAAGCLLRSFGIAGGQIGKIGIAIINAQIELAGETTIAEAQQAVDDTI